MTYQDIPMSKPPQILTKDDCTACMQVMEAMQAVKAIAEQCKGCGVDTRAAEAQIAKVYADAKAIVDSFFPGE